MAKSFALGMGCSSSLLPKRACVHLYPTRASQWGHYEVSTTFVDDTIFQLLAVHKATQMVVCSNQALDRARLHRFATWSLAAPLVIFDVSPASRSSILARARDILPKSTLLRHVACDTFGCEECSEALVAAGYKGDRPSIWTSQGLDLFCVLVAVSSHAMKGSYFVGHLRSLQSCSSDEAKDEKALRQKLLGHGLDAVSVQTLSCSEGDCVFFVSKQLRLSEEQVCFGLREIEMAEEVEEDGFEDW